MLTPVVALGTNTISEGVTPRRGAIRERDWASKGKASKTIKVSGREIARL